MGWPDCADLRLRVFTAAASACVFLQMQEMAAAWVVTNSAAAPTAFLCLLTLGFVLFVPVGILYGVAQLSLGMATTTLEGETDRSPSRGPWSTPLRFMDAVRPGFPFRRATKSGAGSDGRFTGGVQGCGFLGGAPGRKAVLRDVHDGCER